MKLPEALAAEGHELGELRFEACVELVAVARAAELLTPSVGAVEVRPMEWVMRL